jgi:hypothetical protein
MKKFLYRFKEAIFLLAAIVSIIGGMAWHHHKYHHSQAQEQAVERERQKNLYKMRDDETRLKIYQNMEERGHK